MRIVYDASAQRSDNSLSLNGCLHAGPNLLQGLTGILLKFRVHPIAFVADIEKAFLQIELNAADRDATRFLWLKDVTQSARDLTNVDVFRFCRVLFGAAPSPFLLGATIHHHLDRHGDDWISQDLKAAMNMDNVVTGTASDSQALQYYARSRTLLHRAGMNLHQWTTNSQPLRDQVRRGGTGAASTVKVLGLMWDSDCDTLSLSLKAVLEDTKNLPTLTKRFALSAVASIFDPCGVSRTIHRKGEDHDTGAVDTETVLGRALANSLGGKMEHLVGWHQMSLGSRGPSTVLCVHTRPTPTAHILRQQIVIRHWSWLKAG